MKKLTIALVALFPFISLNAQELRIQNPKVSPMSNTVKKFEGVNKSTDGGESTESKGLKEALTLGAKVAAAAASKEDGFYKNELIQIQFPDEVVKVKERLTKMGLGAKVDEFEKSMNRAAEGASKQAFGILSNSIQKMTVQDVVTIVRGADTAATHYLRTSSSNELYRAFEPVVKTTLQEAKVSTHWNTLTSAYNKIPGVSKVDTDIESYVINKTINGLMTLIAEKEKDIRKNPAAQASDLIAKLFGK